MKIDRRKFLYLSGLSLVTPYALVCDKAAAATTARSSAAATTTILRQDANPVWFQFDPTKPSQEAFSLSVASGDPTTSGVIIWTRVNNDARLAGTTPLAFQVAEDPEFTAGLIEGIVNGEDVKVDNDYTVKVDLNVLQPGRRYYYRFIYNGIVSRTGRCQTLPVGSIDRVKFAVLTCQDFTNGYYGAFAHLAREEDVDFVVHLGDFIYESASDSRFQSLPFADRLVILPSGQQVAFDLADFRSIYRTYRADPFLQQAMEQHTWINIWDDHETANDCYWDYERDTLGAPDHPYSTAAYGNNPERLNKLKLDAQRAWAEYVPARIQVNPNATRPHDFFSIYRQFQFGNLVDLFMTDERTYRSAHPCGERDFGDRYASLGCSEQFDSRRTMLGREQREWLRDGIITSNAVWKVWGNQVFQAPLRLSQTDRSVYINLDAWDGYAAERSELARQFKRNGVRNLIVLTGDLHTYIASYLKINYAFDPFNIIQGNLVGVEFMTPAVTSSNLKEIFASRGLSFSINELPIRITNPHIRFFNSDYWGYSTVEFNRRYCEYTAYDIDKSINSQNVRKRVIKRLRVPINSVRIVDAGVNNAEMSDVL